MICNVCKGKGKIHYYNPAHPQRIRYEREVVCSNCGGKGFIRPFDEQEIAIMVKVDRDNLKNYAFGVADIIMIIAVIALIPTGIGWILPAIGLYMRSEKRAEIQKNR